MGNSPFISLGWISLVRIQANREVLSQTFRPCNSGRGRIDPVFAGTLGSDFIPAREKFKVATYQAGLVSADDDTTTLWCSTSPDDEATDCEILNPNLVYVTQAGSDCRDRWTRRVRQEHRGAFGGPAPGIHLHRFGGYVSGSCSMGSAFGDGSGRSPSPGTACQGSPD